MGWRRFSKRRWWDREWAREIDAYLEIETADNVARGMDPDDAAAAARRKFGNPVLVREEIYDMNSIGWLENLWQDLRYGARLLRLSPGFALVAIVSLALGIGANTAIFQLLDAVRLRSLPIQNPNELAEVRIVGGNRGMGINPSPYGQLTRPLWQQIRDQQQAFNGVFAWTTGTFRVGLGSELRRAAGMAVTGEFFRTLGVRPERGRLLLPEDEATCPATRAVVSYSYWRNEMGGGDLGRLTVNGDLLEIVGVTPPEFFGLAVGERFDIAIPLCRPKSELRRDIFDVAVMGRLRPGWTVERASAYFDAISPGVFEQTTITGYGGQTIENYKHFRLGAYPASGGVSRLRAAYDSSLWLLLGITGLTLLIACANLANLTMARATVREREVAVRLAIGASRGRLLRQLLAESALLAAVGVALGIGLAQILSRVLVWSLSTGSRAVDLPIETDWRVLLFAAGVGALTCLVFGALPAVRASRTEPSAAMKTGGRGLTAGRERFSAQRVTMVTQIAISLMLLAGGLLFVRSFQNLMTFDAGMRQDGVTLAYLGFQQSHIAREQFGEFQKTLLEEARSTPGVLGAATTTNIPLLGGSWGHGVRVGTIDGSSMFTWVSPGYFRLMNIPLLAGRDFDQNDTRESRRVAVVNQTFIRQYLNGADPLGKTMRTSPEPNYPATVYEIVGVIPDTQYDGLRGATPPMTFAPGQQFPAMGPFTTMMIHASTPPAVTMTNLRRRIGEKHPEIMMDFEDFQKRIHDGLVRERLMAMLSGFFGALAALLSTVGLYGVISYIVTRKRSEIGIRLALGARRGQVIGMMMREAGIVLAIGVAIGTGLSLLLGRSAGALLFGLKSYDPLTLATAGGLLAVIAAGASFAPANRASKLDPMMALRHE